MDSNRDGPFIAAFHAIKVDAANQRLLSISLAVDFGLGAVW
jgi:hypothetical protein